MIAVVFRGARGLRSICSDDRVEDFRSFRRYRLAKCISRIGFWIDFRYRRGLVVGWTRSSLRHRRGKWSRILVRIGYVGRCRWHRVRIGFRQVRIGESANRCGIYFRGELRGDQGELRLDPVFRRRCNRSIASRVRPIFLGSIYRELGFGAIGILL